MTTPHRQAETVLQKNLWLIGITTFQRRGTPALPLLYIRDLSNFRRAILIAVVLGVLFTVYVMRHMVLESGEPAPDPFSTHVIYRQLFNINEAEL